MGSYTIRNARYMLYLLARSFLISVAVLLALSLYWGMLGKRPLRNVGPTVFYPDCGFGAADALLPEYGGIPELVARRVQYPPQRLCRNADCKAGCGCGFRPAWNSDDGAYHLFCVGAFFL